MNKQYILDNLLQKYNLVKIKIWIEMIKKDPMNIHAGKSVLYYYFLDERLNTKVHGRTFYEFYESRDNITMPSLLKTFEKMKYKKTPIDYYRIFRLYYGSVSPFSISNAYSIIKQYTDKITTIMDPCSGWGGRAVGAELNNKTYYGFDTNVNLEEPMKNLLSHFPNNKIVIECKDALTIDYSQYEYDCVFTSPPYYNIEVYSHMETRTRKEWYVWYKTLFDRLFNSLKSGGLMILNINKDMYINCFQIYYGEADEVRPMNLTSHRNNYSESVYIWIKI
jgi:hypothetical protein